MMGRRVVCQFSCGAASAVATKLAIGQFHDCELLIVNAFLAEEDADNRRFLADCERWFGRPVQVLRDEKYNASAIEVFRRERYLKGRNGAPCSRALKRRLLDTIKRPDDLVVFGFTAEEQGRYDDFRESFPELRTRAPLIEQGLTKEDCKAMVLRAGIELPRMYRLGYENANCIGCVKGGEGYFRAIREDFPEQFATLAAIEAEVCDERSYLLRHRSGPDEGKRFALRDLPPGSAVRNEKLPSCSFFCELAEANYAA